MAGHELALVGRDRGEVRADLGVEGVEACGQVGGAGADVDPGLLELRRQGGHDGLHRDRVDPEVGIAARVLVVVPCLFGAVDAAGLASPA